MDPITRRTHHYTELPDLPPDHVLYHEWNAFRAALPRLLAEGHEGEFALVKGDQILGLFPTREAGLKEGYKRFLYEPFMLHPIRTEEPIYRVPRFW
jgi:hypothetical protein